VTHSQLVRRAAIAGRVPQPVHLIIDCVLLHDRHNLLATGLAFRWQIVPLIWHMLSHAESSGLSDQQAILAEAIALLPAEVRIMIHADRKFRSQALFAQRICGTVLGGSAPVVQSLCARPGPTRCWTLLEPVQSEPYCTANAIRLLLMADTRGVS